MSMMGSVVCNDTDGGSGPSDQLPAFLLKALLDLMGPCWMFVHDTSAGTGIDFSEWNDLMRSESSHVRSACSEAELLCVVLHSGNLLDGRVGAFSRLPQS